MIQMTLSEAAALLNVQPTSTDITFHGLSIDTRTVTPGALFLAIQGNRVDGHDFINTAQEKGASAALVTRRVDSSLPQLVVEDIVLAIGQLAAHWRSRFRIPFIAVTGSNGKTTLKNMIAAILSASASGHSDQVLATIGNLNNHLGLPLTLARLNEHHRYAVIEMGMNHFGEIAYLTKLTQPTIAAITNAGPSHLEGVGDLAGVARAKAEIFLGLPKDGTAILNRDDEFFAYWQNEVNQYTTLSFGLHASADVRADIIGSSTESQQLSVHTPCGKIEIRLPLLGKHNVLNALAAIAATLAAGIELSAIKQGLEEVAPAQGRMQVHQLTNQVTVIDDSYNASPASLRAAVDTLATFKGTRIVVLGDMKELGIDEKNHHRDAGEHIHQLGIEHLLTLGDLSALSAKAFGANAQTFTDHASMLKALTPLIQPHTTILVKGSRSMRMETIVQSLINPETSTHSH